MSEEVQKRKILDILSKAYPCDLSVGEIAKTAKISDITASKYLSVLKAEGKIEISRKIGNAVLYKIKEKSK